MIGTRGKGGKRNTPEKPVYTEGDPHAGRYWGQEEKGTTEMAGWHHRLDGHEFE